MKVAVIVDSADPGKRRRCFWVELLLDLDTQYDIISLAEASQELRSIDYESYDVVVLNWDVANGDPTFNSDRTQHLLQRHQKHGHIESFVKNGGVLVLEAQTSHWIPTQTSYDSVLGRGEVVVSASKEPEVSPVGVVNTTLHEHPVLFRLASEIRSAYRHDESSGWFPEDSVSPKAIELTHPEKLYSGSFRRWKKNWLPLIYNRNGTHPIVLVKTWGMGMLVATTMFIASSNQKAIVRNLINCKKMSPFTILYHQKILTRKILFRVGAFLSLIATFGVSFVILSHLVEAGLINASFTVNVLISISVTVAAWLLNRIGSYLVRIWRYGRIGKSEQ